MNPVLHPKFGSYRQILLLSGPLILSQTSVMLMQIVDGLFLTWYSPDAIAAAGPGGMLFWTVLGLCSGVAGYSGTFVAQYIGAGRSRRVGAAVWQGIYVALIGGVLVLLLAPLSGVLFAHLGHAPRVAALETVFFRTFCYGGPLFVLNAALAGFFSGRNDNRVLMAVQLLGTLINAVLAWALIFGRLGLPGLGIAGAALAAIAAHLIMVFCLAGLFLRRAHREQFGAWADRAFDWALFQRLCVYGFPNGVRMMVEILAWTVFVIFVGRVDALSLAASNIVWRLNTFAFFPLLGLGTATAMLVGQAQGAGRPDLAERVTWRGLVIAEVWMLLAAALFITIPAALMNIFVGWENAPVAQAAPLRAIGIVLLRFVAVYCLLDSMNVVLMSALQGAGDTRWTLLATLTTYALFVAALLVCDQAYKGLYVFWTIATVLVMTLALIWLARFFGGQWKTMRVIEHAPADLAE